MTVDSASGEPGFTLVEVLVAMAVLIVVATGVVSSAVVAAASATRSRETTLATLLAIERVEQLRALRWGYGDSLAPFSQSDLSTDVSTPAASGGGAGLAVSAAGSLMTNTSGLVDYLDGTGRWIGNGGQPPPNTVFVRRWRVSRLPGSSDTVVFEVVVAHTRGRSTAADPVRPDDIRLVAMKARKAF